MRKTKTSICMTLVIALMVSTISLITVAEISSSNVEQKEDEIFELEICFYTDEPFVNNIFLLIHPNASVGEDMLDILDPPNPPQTYFNAWLSIPGSNDQFMRDARPPAKTIKWEVQSFNMGFNDTDVVMSWDLNITQQLSPRETLYLIDGENVINMKSQGSYEYTWQYTPGSPYSMSIIYSHITPSSSRLTTRSPSPLLRSQG